MFELITVMGRLRLVQVPPEHRARTDSGRVELWFNPLRDAEPFGWSGKKTAMDDFFLGLRVKNTL
jgi:hypothetical protein